MTDPHIVRAGGAWLVASRSRGELRAEGKSGDRDIPCRVASSLNASVKSVAADKRCIPSRSIARKLQQISVETSSAVSRLYRIGREREVLAADIAGHKNV